MDSPGPSAPRHGAGGTRATAAAEEKLAETESIPSRTGRFVLLGSLRLVLGTEASESADPRLWRSIVRGLSVEEPDFVGLLGDLVFCGSSEDAWLQYDRMTSPLKAEGIPVYPVLGNHEYWISSRAALANYFGRFPRLERRRWYAVRYGPLGLAFLDSNAQWLPAAAWREQCAWLERLLRAWDSDETIAGGVVLLHHPPFARERATADTQRVHRDVVPLFASARKTLAMISGHSHGEARHEGGKAYLVASSRPAPPGSAARRAAAPEAPPFRWLRVSFDRSSAALVVETRELHRGASTGETVDRLELGLGTAPPGR